MSTKRKHQPPMRPEPPLPEALDFLSREELRHIVRSYAPLVEACEAMRDALLDISHGGPLRVIKPALELGHAAIAKAHVSDYEMRARSVRCTYCGARVQANCRDEEGRETRPHCARLDNYKRSKALESV